MEGEADTRRKPKMHSFFKVLIGDYATKLRIPVLFTNRYRSVIPKNVALRASSNKSWRVDIEEEGDKELYFKTGWKTFAEDNRLENGEFVVFKYDGNSTFKVKIFGISACQKDLQMGTNQNSDDTAGTENQNEKQPVPQKNLKERSPIAENRLNLKQADEGQRRKGTQIKEENADSNDNITQGEGSRNAGVSKRTDEKEAKEESNEFIDIEPDDLAMKICMYKRPMQNEVNKSSKLDPKNPSFRVLVKQAYAEKGLLSIPTKFFKQHMINKRQNVEIQTSKGAWNVTLVPIRRGKCTYARFSGGWTGCARDNHFKAGEALIFKMIQRNRPKFIIHKLRKR